MWIYFDAGLGKVSDPLRGWTTEPVQIEGMTILPGERTVVKGVTGGRWDG